MSVSLSLIPIRGVPTVEIDTPLGKFLPALSPDLQRRLHAQRMASYWQVAQFTAEQLITRGFTPADIAWLCDRGKQLNVPLGMVIGENPLMEVIGHHVERTDPNPAHDWVYAASIWELIGHSNLTSFSRKQIEHVLLPTPYRIGMSATHLFTSAGSP